jgi:sugar O-acyltransferase (sialic acid O-acetyltransferase NeuD family)
MKPIAIYGAGSLGREMLMLIRQINEYQLQWDPIGFFDDNPENSGQIHGLSVLGTIDDLNRYNEELNLVLAFGMPEVKKSALLKIKNNKISYPALHHPSVQIAPYQQITMGEGTIITSGNILSVDINIGSHVLINLNCTLGHDLLIEDFASVMPGCNISGDVTIKEGCFIGTGATILNGCTIHKNAKVGAGSMVLRDVSEHTTVFGVPAKAVIKRNIL